MRRLSTTQGGFESALPGEWATLLLAVALVALLGGLILAVTCVRHERVVARRVRSRRRGAGLRDAGTGAGTDTGVGADRRYRR